MTVEQITSPVVKLLNECSDLDISVTTLLRKTKVIATKLGDDEFLKFINDELKGYNNIEIELLPDYRKAFFPIEYNHPVRGNQFVSFRDRKIEEAWCRRGIKQSISEVERLAVNNKPMILTMLADGQQAMREGTKQPEAEFWWYIPSSVFINTLEQVREIVHNWCLALEKKGIFGESITFTEKEKTELKSEPTNIHNLFINHGMINNNGNFSVGNSRSTILQNDFEILKKTLQSYGASEPQIKELAQLIESEAKDKLITKKGTLGTKLAAWLSSVLKTAGTTLSAEILIQCIQPYL